MHLSSTIIAGLLLVSADGVLGGSRFWESKAPNKRTNPSPDYVAIESLNATSPLVKRAMSIEDLPGDNEAPRLWPGKKIRYCFDNRNTRIRGLWEMAMEAWSGLDRHGFTYEEVSNSVCNSQRKTVLRIYYNDRGKLSSTMGIPPIDEEWNRNNPDHAIEGPYTHLSDMEGVGQDNIQANVAHELGHVWGLAHEHQNPWFWKVSSGDSGKGYSFPSVGGAEKHFQTNGFKCENLKDYESAHQSVRDKIAKETDAEKKEKLEGDLERLCISPQAAGDHFFSASEWLPLASTNKFEPDLVIDRDSIMMYPSGAGGKGSGTGRAAVMVFEDGKTIPNRLVPTGRDVDTLVTLYGNAASSTPAQPHTSKSSSFRNGLRKIRSKMFRAGDTQAGLC